MSKTTIQISAETYEKLLVYRSKKQVERRKKIKTDTIISELLDEKLTQKEDP